MAELRKYQEEMLEEIMGWLSDYHNQNKNLCVDMPTGSGKSWEIGALVERAWADDRLKDADGDPPGVIVLTPQKELLEQDLEKFAKYAPDLAPKAGVWSASCGKREVGEHVTFATIGSVYKLDPSEYGWALAVVDEAHLINNQEVGMYRTFLKGIPKVVGFTATPYRMTQGKLTEGKDALFQEILSLPSCSVKALEEEGVLAKAGRLPAELFAGLDSIAIGIDGDFKDDEADRVVNTSENNRKACRIIARTIEQTGRRHCLVFCISIEHANDCAALLRQHKISVAAVSGKTPKSERKELLTRFKDGSIECLCNVGVLTTGFDAPETDLIVFLRPTLSMGLYSQMCGRGQRPTEEKKKRQADEEPGFALLDFVGNIDRFGLPDALKPFKKKDPKFFGGEIDPAVYFYRCRTHNKMHMHDMPSAVMRMPDGSQVGYVPCPECGSPMMLLKQCPKCGSDLVVAEEGLTGSLEEDIRKDEIDRCPVWTDSEKHKRCNHKFFETTECPICTMRQRGKPYYCPRCKYDFIQLCVQGKPKMERKPVTLWQTDVTRSKAGRPMIRLFADRRNCVYLTYSNSKSGKLLSRARKAARAILEGAGRQYSPEFDQIQASERLREELERCQKPEVMLLGKKEDGTPDYIQGFQWQDGRLAWLS